MLTYYQLGYLACMAGFSNSGDWMSTNSNGDEDFEWEIGWHEAHND